MKTEIVMELLRVSGIPNPLILERVGVMLRDVGFPDPDSVHVHGGRVVLEWKGLLNLHVNKSTIDVFKSEMYFVSFKDMTKETE